MGTASMRARVGLAGVALLLTAGTSVAQFSFTYVHGQGRYEKIKGHPAAGYRTLYETNLFVTPLDSSQVMGAARRLGTTFYSSSACHIVNTYDGAYCIGSLEKSDGSQNDLLIPGGSYTMLIGEPLFFVGSNVIQNVNLVQGQVNVVNADLPIDYSTYFYNDWVGNTSQGDYRSASSPWYQTFMATGYGIRGITVSYVGADPDTLSIAVLEDNGNANPINWTVLGERTVNNPAAGSGLNDNWVRWRSGEIPTTPGVSYAVRVTGHGGPLNGAFQPTLLRDGPFSYEHGQSYDGNGIPHPEDLNITVFADNDDTVVTMNNRNGGMGTLKDPDYWGTAWGHTFIAKGSSLAGVDVKAACVNNRWETDFRWTVFAGNAYGPTGPQIGPTKITNAAWNPGGFYQAVSYAKNQVPLVKGQTYFIKFEAYYPFPDSNGFNPYIMNNDYYSDGHGFWWNQTTSTWIARPSDDVNMTILEYRAEEPIISVTPTSLEHTIGLGDSMSSDTIYVQNIGEGTLNYNISVDYTGDAGWLNPVPSSGSSTTEQDAIAIHYAAAGLSCGAHHATITVSGNAEESREVDVTVNVGALWADTDCDSDVDQADFGEFQRCTTGQGLLQTDPTCAWADDNGDLIVDGDDFVAFQKCFSGADVPADLSCAD